MKYESISRATHKKHKKAISKSTYQKDKMNKQ